MTLERKGMRHIYAAIGKRMAESQQYATQPFVWAQREAALLAIGYQVIFIGIIDNH